MISNELLYDAYMANADKVISLEILGGGVYLLHLVGEDYPQKLNASGVMKVFSELENEDWVEVESDDGHSELYAEEEISDEDWNAACDHWDMLHDLHGLAGFQEN